MPHMAITYQREVAKDVFSRQCRDYCKDNIKDNRCVPEMIQSICYTQCANYFDIFPKQSEPMTLPQIFDQQIRQNVKDQIDYLCDDDDTLPPGTPILDIFLVLAGLAVGGAFLRWLGNIGKAAATGNAARAAELGVSPFLLTGVGLLFDRGNLSLEEAVQQACKAD
jgi:hypothetical protein